MTNSTNTMPVRALCDLAQSGTLLKGDLTVTYISQLTCFFINIQMRYHQIFINLGLQTLYDDGTTLPKSGIPFLKITARRNDRVKVA